MLRSPKGDFCVHLQYDPRKVEIVAPNRQVKCTLQIPNDFDKQYAYIAGVSVSEDEKYIILHEIRGKGMYGLYLYERVRPLIYRLSKKCPKGCISDAAWAYYKKTPAEPEFGYWEWTIFVGWRNGSRDMVVELDTDKKKKLATVDFNTTTGRVRKVRK